MRRDVAKVWIDALRSGEFKQGKGQLQIKDQFCCLGVLCKVAERAGVTIEMMPGNSLGAQEVSGGLIQGQPEVVAWAGLKHGGLIKSTDENNDLDLITLNDTYDKTFLEIADIIQTNWEQL